MKKFVAVFGLIVLVLFAAAAFFLPIENSEAQSDLGVDPAEPDMPRIWDRSRSTFGKEEFLKERADAYAIKRGIVDGKLPDCPVEALAKAKEKVKVVLWHGLGVTPLRALQEMVSR